MQTVQKTRIQKEAEAEIWGKRVLVTDYPI
jgi:hypothetical protein